MLYLTDKDAKILTDLLEEISQEGVLIKFNDLTTFHAFKSLVNASFDYTTKCRDKAKKYVQERRKVDKSYAHTKKKEN